MLINHLHAMHGRQVQKSGRNFPTFSKIYEIQIYIAIYIYLKSAWKMHWNKYKQT